MKKFYALLLALNIVAIGTSAPVFAIGDDVASNNQLIVVNEPTTIDEQQLVHVFNIALTNPKILKQLKDQLALVHQMPTTDREVYDKMMMAANLQLIEGMNKKLNPKKDEKKETTLLQSTLNFAKEAAYDSAKITAPWVLTLFLVSRMPVFRHLFGIADTGLGFFSWLIAI